VASPSSHAIGFEKIGVVDVVVSPSRVSSRCLVPIVDRVVKSNMPGDVVTREVCDFLATLAATFPRSTVD
jgi:hypothetical protein